MKCRHCSAQLEQSLIDLGFAPASNAYLSAGQLSRPEKYYPLRVVVCNTCWLVQTEDYAAADELFDENYAYFSSTSKSWLLHAEQYCDKMTALLNLNSNSLVVELASNDGYLLKNFVENHIPCLGIEPTKSTAQAAEKLGIPVLQKFFGQAVGQTLADEGKLADLVLGNNVYAHVPDINDFTLGIKAILKPSGTVTLEFPHLANLMAHKQFDTIYHEHFSYLSLLAVQKIFESCGLRVHHVDELPTHGGSLRIYGCHHADSRATSDSVGEVLAREVGMGLDRAGGYAKLQDNALAIKLDVMDFLTKQKRLGKKVAAYGAAAKGNTLLNYCGIHADLVSYVCDAASSKQGHYMPGSHIPIVSPSRIAHDRPDFILILPWNLRSEVVEQLSFARQWGARFVTVVPEIEIF